MPSFFELKEGGWPVYGLVASFALLVIGGASTIYYELVYEEPVIKTMMCYECNHVEDMRQEKFLEMVQAREEEYRNNPDAVAVAPQAMPGMDMPGGMPGGMMMQPWGQAGWPLECPSCNQDSFYDAVRCQNCGEVFYRNMAERYPDTCPSCNFSRTRQMQEQRQAEEEAARQRRRDRQN